MSQTAAAVPIVPCADLDESSAFYARLGFAVTADYSVHGYRILHRPDGSSIHLTRVEAAALAPDRCAHGIYLYAAELDALAAATGARAEVKPWGLRELALSDPSGVQVRIGWPA